MIQSAKSRPQANPYEAPGEANWSTSATGRLGRSTWTAALTIGVVASAMGEGLRRLYSVLVPYKSFVWLTPSEKVLDNAARMACHYISGIILGLGFLFLCSRIAPSLGKAARVTGLCVTAMLLPDLIGWTLSSGGSVNAGVATILAYLVLKSTLVAAVVCWQLDVPVLRVEFALLMIGGGVACVVLAQLPWVRSFNLLWPLVAAIQLNLLLRREQEPPNRSEFLPDKVQVPNL